MESSDELEQENSLSVCLTRLLASEPELLNRSSQFSRNHDDSMSNYSSVGKIYQHGWLHVQSITPHVLLCVCHTSTPLNNGLKSGVSS